MALYSIMMTVSVHDPAQLIARAQALARWRIDDPDFQVTSVEEALVWLSGFERPVSGALIEDTRADRHVLDGVLS